MARASILLLSYGVATGFRNAAVSRRPATSLYAKPLARKQSSHVPAIVDEDTFLVRDHVLENVAKFLF